MSLYPRLTPDGKLVSDDQLVPIREHFSAQHRLLFMTGVISQETESHNLLLALDSLSHKPIKLVITSPGGDLDSTFLFYDTLRLVKSPIWTYGRFCASAAVLILAVGKRRYLSPHAKVMLHLPAGQMAGDARDWEIQHEEMQKYKQKMVEILKECGAKKPTSEILQDMDRDFWLEPEEAIDYGFADGIMTPRIWRSWIK